MSVEQQRLEYGEILRVVGMFVQQERLTDISILQYEGGWIVHGLTFEATATGFLRANKDFVLSDADVQRLHEEYMRQRKQPTQTKSRWLG